MVHRILLPALKTPETVPLILVTPTRQRSSTRAARRTTTRARRLATATPRGVQRLHRHSRGRGRGAWSSWRELIAGGPIPVTHQPLLVFPKMGGHDDRRRMAALGRLCFRTNGQSTARRPRAAILLADDARIVRRGATRECVETTTHIPWAAEGVAMVPSSLRDEMVWRDGSAEADGWKPTATFGGRSATKDKNQTSPIRWAACRVSQRLPADDCS